MSKNKKLKTWPTLYKRTAGGGIQEWDCHLEYDPEGTAIVVTHGLQGGKKQVSRDVIKEGKNAGRRNSTTHYEQADKEAEAAWAEKQERKHYGLTVEESAVKREIAPMLAKDYSKFAHKVDWRNAFMQPKLDGNRGHARRNGNKVTIVTREGLLVETVPHIQRMLLSIMPDDTTWDGELYIHGVPLPQINSLLRREQEDSAKICFNLYDVLMDEGYIDRRQELLRCITANKGPIHLVETLRVADENELMAYQAKCVDLGYEGAILRWGDKPYEAGKRSDSLLKVKTFADAEFEVVGCKEGRGLYRGMAVFRCKTEAGHEFDVTAPGTLEKKRAYYATRDKWIGKMLTVKYQCFTSTEMPVPFHPVAKAFK